MIVAPAIWFPTIHTGTGTDVFTERLAAGLRGIGLRAEITWLPLRAEYAPWTVSVPSPPPWATICHVSTWLHPRFVPKHLPVVATIHHSVHDPALRPYKGLLRSAYHKYWIAPIERNILKRANRVIAVSKFVSDMAKKELCDVSMQVVYNGVDSNLYHPGDKIKTNTDPFKLLYVGGWKKLKGIDLLSPIMRGLGNDFELYYTGPSNKNGKGGDAYMPPGNMINMGRLTQQEVILAMQQADALLFPSVTEGLPQVVIEAMACNLPVVATRGSSLIEVVNDDVGILCQQGNIRDFISACRHVKMRVSSMQNYFQQPRNLAIHKFSLNEMIMSYYKIYTTIKIKK